MEADETYVGGKRHDGMRGRGASGKTPVVGTAERKGEIRLEVTENTKAVTLDKIITDHVEPGATVMTDEYRPYSHVTKLGYKHRRVNHGNKDFVIGQNHTNTICCLSNIDSVFPPHNFSSNCPWTACRADRHHAS